MISIRIYKNIPRSR